MPEYNFTEDFNVTELSPEKTLEGSELVKLDINNTSTDTIQRTFCREVYFVIIITFTFSQHTWILTICSHNLPYPINIKYFFLYLSQTDQSSCP